MIACSLYERCRLVCKCLQSDSETVRCAVQSETDKWRPETLPSPPSTVLSVYLGLCSFYVWNGDCTTFTQKATFSTSGL